MLDGVGAVGGTWVVLKICGFERGGFWDVIPGLKIGAESHGGTPNVIPGGENRD